MSLADEIELQSAREILRMAERYLRYLKKEGEFAEPRWWEVFQYRLPPIPVSADMVRHAQAKIEAFKVEQEQHQAEQMNALHEWASSQQKDDAA
jgi:hypothetical protein